MTGPYATAIMVLALVLALWALLLVALNRLPGRALVLGAVALEAMLVGLLGGGVVQMLRTSHHFNRLVFVVYLLACVAIPPAAGFWASGEKSRSGTAVIAVAFLIPPVMVIRLQQIWAGPGA